MFVVKFLLPIIIIERSQLIKADKVEQYMHCLSDLGLSMNHTTAREKFGVSLCWNLLQHQWCVVANPHDSKH